MTDSFDTIHVIETLKFKCQEDKKLADLIYESLRKARITAKTDIDVELYNALIWPHDVTEYLQYLAEFVKWVPQQNSQSAWNKPGIESYQEVFDRLSHFYWLIDQKVGFNNNLVVENIPWFKNWLLDYAKLWKQLMKATDQFCQEILDSFIFDAPLYKMQNSLIDGRPTIPVGWLNCNSSLISTPGDHSVLRV